MKKLIALILALVLCVAFAGCGRSTGAPPDGTAQAPPADTGTVDNGTTDNDTAEQAAPPEDPAAQPSGPYESYLAYVEMKTALVSRISDGLTAAQPMAAMHLLGLSMIDLSLLPLTAIGLDEASMVTVLSFFGVSGLEYNVNGNSYTVSYADNEGNAILYETTYDPAGVGAVTRLSQSGAETMIFEYTKTSYGYASQYYMKNDDGTYAVYKCSLYNNDGIIGVSNAADGQPPSILGTEPPKDFPKDCDNWFGAEGTSGTGKTEDGATLEFTVPAEAPSN